MPGSSEEIEETRPRGPERRIAIVVVVLAVALAAAGISVYAALLPSGTNPVKLHWSTVLTGQAIGGFASIPPCSDGPGLGSGGPDPGLRDRPAAGLRPGPSVFWTPRSRTWATLGAVAAGVAGACNIVQDLLLRQALGDGLPPGALLDWAEVLSFIKFTALLVAAPVGIVAITVSVGRLTMSKKTRNAGKTRERSTVPLRGRW